MKKFTCIMAGLFVIVFMGILSGCGSSDSSNNKDTDNVSSLDSQLIGTWAGVWGDEYCNTTQNITFESDGTFTYYSSESCYHGDVYDSEEGVWHTRGGRLYVTVTHAEGEGSEDVDLNQEFSMPYIVASDGSALAILDGDDLEDDGLDMIRSDGGIVGEWQSPDDDVILTINDDNTWVVSDYGEGSNSGTYLLQGNMITLSYDGSSYTLFGVYTIIDSRLYLIFESDGLLLKD